MTLPFPFFPFASPTCAIRTQVGENDLWRPGAVRRVLLQFRYHPAAQADLKAAGWRWRFGHTPEQGWYRLLTADDEPEAIAEAAEILARHFADMNEVLAFLKRLHAAAPLIPVGVVALPPMLPPWDIVQGGYMTFPGGRLDVSGGKFLLPPAPVRVPPFWRYWTMGQISSQKWELLFLGVAQEQQLPAIRDALPGHLVTAGEEFLSPERLLAAYPNLQAAIKALGMCVLPPTSLLPGM